MLKGKLKKAAKLAARVRKAIGAAPDEEVEVYVAQTGRSPGAPTAGPAPRTKAEWAALVNKSAAELRAMGLRKWAQRHEHPDGSQSGELLWLFPSEWYPSIPKGHAIVDIDFNERKFDGRSDRSTRSGCLSFGFLQDIEN